MSGFYYAAAQANGAGIKDRKLPRGKALIAAGNMHLAPLPRQQIQGGGVGMGAVTDFDLQSGELCRPGRSSDPMQFPHRENVTNLFGRAVGS